MDISDSTLKVPPPQTLAQKAELIAQRRALQLGKDKKLHTFTDSKCRFHMLQAHAAIWKESKMLTTRSFPQNEKI